MICTKVASRSNSNNLYIREMGETCKPGTSVPPVEKGKSTAVNYKFIIITIIIDHQIAEIMDNED